MRNLPALWTVAAFVVALVAAFLVVNLTDRSLDPGAAEVLEARGAEVPAGANLYLALSEHAPSTYPGMPDGGLCLRVSGEDGMDDCLRMVASNAMQAEWNLFEQSDLLERYLALHDYDRFHNLSPESIDINHAQWRLAARGHLLFHTDVALKVHRDELDEAVAALAGDTRHWRGILAEPGLWLLDKMYVATLVIRNADLAAAIAATQPLDDGQRGLLAQVFRPVEQAERTLAPQLEREFRILAGTVDELAGEGWTRFIVPVTYRPNATANTLYRYLQADLEAAGADCGTEPDGAAGDIEADRRNPLNYAVNPLGNLTAWVAWPDRSDYHARICALESALTGAVQALN